MSSSPPEAKRQRRQPLLLGYIYLFLFLRLGRDRTLESALRLGRENKSQPWLLAVSQAGAVAREMSWDSLMQSERGTPASLAVTKDTERSGVVAREAVWRVGCWLAWAVQGLGDLRLPDPDQDRQLVRWADGLTGLGRNGPLASAALTFERGTE